MERLRVPAPGFDPARHGDTLLAKVAETHGSGWEIESFDPNEEKVTLIRGAVVAQMQEVDLDAAPYGATMERRLPHGTKPSDGDKQAQRLEDAYPGFYMTTFEPFLGQAILTKLTRDEARCRGAVATHLGAKPWEVGVKAREDAGFDLTLPLSYKVDKEKALWAVATGVVGRDGWYVEVDAKELTASIIPAEPPTFPSAYPTPLELVGAMGPDEWPIGYALALPGEEQGETLAVRWGDSAFTMVGGSPRSGKSVLLTGAVFHDLANGGELVIVDDRDKANDFREFRKFVRKGGWGVDSPQHRVAALGLINDEIERRAAVLESLGLNDWMLMPATERFAPILIVVDELALIVPKDPPLKSLPKDHPMRLEVDAANVAKDILGKYINDIVAKARFVGVRMILASQILNEKTGAGPTLRGKFGNFILQGANPTEQLRSQVFAAPKEVPYVPANIKADANASRGVAVCHLWGESPAVVKGFYASVSDLVDYLDSIKVPTTPVALTAPSTADIDRFMPQLDDDLDEQPQERGGERAPSGRSATEVRKAMGDEAVEGYDANGKRLRGAAAAAHALKVVNAATPTDSDDWDE